MLQRTFSLVAAAVVVTVMAVTANAQPAGTPVLWLDADDSSTIFDGGGVNPGGGGFDATNITQWNDKSASGNVFVSGLTHPNSNAGADTNPEWVGGLQADKPGLRFDDVDALMDTSPAGLPTGNGARHVFFVGIPRENDHAPGNAGVNTYFNYGNAAASQWNNMFLFDSSGGSANTYSSYFAGNDNDYTTGSKAFDVTSPPGDATIIEFMYDGTTATFSKDSVVEGTPGPFASGPINTALTNARVGREPNHRTDWDQFELIVYDEKLNSGDGLATGQYLATKWGIQAYGVPEPSSVLLLLLGSAAMVLGRRRRK